MLNYKNGAVCGIKVVDDEDDILMISTDGIVIRIRACDISKMGRYSKGVRLMRVADGVKVVSFTRTERDEEADTEEVEQASQEEIEASNIGEDPVDEPVENDDES